MIESLSIVTSANRSIYYSYLENNRLSKLSDRLFTGANQLSDLYAMICTANSRLDPIDRQPLYPRALMNNPLDQIGEKIFAGLSQLKILYVPIGWC